MACHGLDPFLLTTTDFQTSFPTLYQEHHIMGRKKLSKNVGRMKRQQMGRGVGTGGVEKARNAFNEIRTRKKFTILGKKSKGDTKRTTQRRSAAVEKVCSPEYSGHSNVLDCSAIPLFERCHECL